VERFNASPKRREPEAAIGIMVTVPSAARHLFEASMLILKGHTAPVWSLAYSPDGRLLAARDQSGKVMVWEPASGRALHSLGGDANTDGGPHAQHQGLYLEAMSFVAADALLTVDFQGQLRWWNLRTNETTASQDQIGRAFRMAVSPDGRRVAFAREMHYQYTGSESGRVCLGNLTGRRASLTNWGCDRTAFCLLFSNRSDLLACGVGEWGRGGLVKLYHIPSSLSVRRWNWRHRDHVELSGPSGPVLSLAFTADDQLLAAGCSDGSVRVWHVADRQQVAHLQRHGDLVRGVAFTADGRSLISVSWDGHVKVWDVFAGREKTTFQWHAGMIHAIAFAPDGMTAATAGQDGNIVVWDVDFG
jgi:WD40 repeat protein